MSCVLDEPAGLRRQPTILLPGKPTRFAPASHRLFITIYLELRLLLNSQIITSDEACAAATRKLRAAMNCAKRQKLKPKQAVTAKVRLVFFMQLSNK